MNLYKLLLTPFLITLTFTLSCPEGYYPITGGCIPCDSSCKECSEQFECESCEDFMFMGVGSGLCEYCVDGEYYDEVIGECRGCEGSCKSLCRYRQECMECSVGQSLDLDTITCVEECDGESQIELTGSQIGVQSACRSFEYYVDPTSTEVLELGTRQYPYRTLRSANSEILNHISHHPVNVTIYTKDAYLEDKTLFYVNMTNVKITSHPEYLTWNRRAVITLTEFAQEGISKKANFHLLKNVDLPIQNVVIGDDFTESEILAAQGFVSCLIFRTGLELNNIDFYREDIDYNKNIQFLNAYYLQSKNFTLINTFINITGQFFTTLYPFNLIIQNTTIDTYSLIQNIQMLIFCNYPESAKNSGIKVKGLKLMNSKDRTISYNPSPIISNLPGNWTIEDYDASDVYGTLEFIKGPFHVGVYGFCVPEDEVVRYIFVDGMKVSYKYQSEAKTNAVSSDLTQTHYRPTYVSFKNVEIFGMINPGFYSVALFGSPIDKVTVHSMSFKNMTINRNMILIVFYGEFIFGDPSQNETSILIDTLTIGETNAFSAQMVGHFELHNFEIKNLTELNGNGIPQIQFFSFPTAIFKVESLKVSESIFLNSQLIRIDNPIDKATFQNIEIRDIKIGPSINLIQINNIKGLTMNSGIFENVTVTDTTDVESSIINIANYNLDGDFNSSITDMNITNSQISFFNVRGLLGETVSHHIFQLQNIKFSNLSFLSPRHLIDTAGFANEGDFVVLMTNLQFINVNFTVRGYLIAFRHKLTNPVVLQDSIFTELDSSSILVKRGDNASSLLSVTFFDNCTFTNNIVRYEGLIKVLNRAQLKIYNCAFTQIMSTFERSTVFHTQYSSRVAIHDSEFTENSGLSSTAFNVESGSYVECNNCSINDNFALTGGVSTVQTNGYIKLVNSIVTRNHAIQASVAQFLDSAETSIIDSSEIYLNSQIAVTEFEIEITSCTNLCFLKDEYKNYIINNNLHLLEESKVALEVILGSLRIQNNSHIHSESYPILSMMSTIEIESSSFYNISFIRTSIKATTSNVTLNNVNITNLQGNYNSEFILGDVHSQVNISTLFYTNSNVILTRITSSKININHLEFENIHGSKDLIQIENSGESELNNIEITNCFSVSKKDIFILRSNNIKINNLVSSDRNQTVIFISKSHINSLAHVQIKNCMKAIEIIESEIDEISEATFNYNGNIDTSVGGAIFIMNSKVNISSSIFTQNNAVQGGAIAFECTSLSSCNLTLDQVNITDNKVFDQGGGIHYNYMRPIITNCIFSNNSAPYGDNLASYPVKIRMTQDIHSEIHLMEVGSGIDLDSPIKLSLLDYDNQTMVLNSHDPISIFASDTSQSSVRGTNTAQLKNGISEFDSIRFVSEIGASGIKYKIVSKAIDSNKISKIHGNLFLNNQITVDFRFCKPGEQIDGNNLCIECSAGTYSLEWNSTFCDKCLLNAFCPGKDEIDVNSGYWRNTKKSVQIKECLLEEACQGGYSVNFEHPVRCATGYSGNLCTQCLITDDDKYARVGDFECVKCSNPISNAVKVIGVAFLVFSFFILMIIVNINKTKESNLSVLFRILTNYIQLITTSIGLTASYPDSIISTFSVTDQIGTSTEAFLSFDCFIEDYEVKGPFGSNAIFKLFLMGLLPIVLFIIISLIWIIIKIVKPSLVRDIGRNLVISFISILFMLHPTIAQQSFELFRCVDIDDGISQTRIDTDIGCHSSQHIMYSSTIAIPIIIIWVVSAPLFALILLFKYIKKSDENKVKNYFLILYQGLKPNRFYWEFVNTARKITMLMTFPLNTSIRLFCTICILLILIKLQNKLKPYKEESFNSLEIMSSYSGVIILVAGLCYSQNNEISALDMIIAIVVLIFNAQFLLIWIYRLLSLYREQSKFIQSFLNIVDKLFSSRSKNFKVNQIEKKYMGPVVSFKRKNKTKKFFRKKNIKRKIDIRKIIRRDVEVEEKEDFREIIKYEERKRVKGNKYNTNCRHLVENEIKSMRDLYTPRFPKQDSMERIGNDSLSSINRKDAMHRLIPFKINSKEGSQKENDEETIFLPQNNSSFQ